MVKNYLKIGLIIIAYAGTAQGSEKPVKHIYKCYPFKSKSCLNISTYKGSVSISPWEKEEIQIRAEIEATLDGKKGKEQTDLTEIKIEVEDDRVLIRSDYRRLKAELNIAGKEDNYEENRRPLRWLLDLTRSLLPNVHYHIKLPPTASVQIKDHKSQIYIAGLNGRLDLDTYKGKMRLEDISGELTCETFKGRAIIENARCNMNLNTFKGCFTLSLPENANFDLDVTIEKGREAYDIPFYGRVYGREKDIACEFPYVQVKQGNRVIRRINGGGPLIRFATYKGKITVKREPINKKGEY